SDQQERFGSKRPCHGSSLLFASGKFRRIAVLFGGKMEPLQNCPDKGAVRDVMVEIYRKADIFVDGHFRNKVKKLKNIPDMPSTENGSLLIRQPKKILIFYDNRALC